MPEFVETTVNGKQLYIETGTLAQQAGGAVTVRYGDTVVLVTATASPGPRPLDFFPLTVDYEERLYAAGKIPGSFFRREGRPGTEAIRFGHEVNRQIIASQDELIARAAKPKMEVVVKRVDPEVEREVRAFLEPRMDALSKPMGKLERNEAEERLRADLQAEFAERI